MDILKIETLSDRIELHDLHWKWRNVFLQYSMHWAHTF